MSFMFSAAATIFHCGVGLKVRTARAKFIIALFLRSYFDLKCYYDENFCFCFRVFLT